MKVYQLPFSLFSSTEFGSVQDKGTIESISLNSQKNSQVLSVVPRLANAPLQTEDYKTSPYAQTGETLKAEEKS